VEVSGIEPPTSSLRTMRSSQLSYTTAQGEHIRHESSRFRLRVTFLLADTCIVLTKNRLVTHSHRPSNRGRKNSSATRCARAVALAFALVLLFAACTPEQQHTMDLVNANRTEAGVVTLLPRSDAIAKAQAWAEHMAAQGAISHSSVADGMIDDWKMLGENVGVGPSMDAVEAAFMASPVHRSNILDPRFNSLGTGVAVGADGRTYVVQVFAQY
jgi:hypothetical protein